jgi:hypothetical protein
MMGRTASAFFTSVLLLLLLQSFYASLQWRPLTSDEIDAWYTPVEQCLMKTTDRSNILPRHAKAKYCKNSEPTRCQIGMGHRTQACSGPYAGRKSFLYGFDGYTSITASPANELVAALSVSNTSLLFVGDSMMQEKMSFWLCQLEREGGTHHSHHASSKEFLDNKETLARTADGLHSVALLEHAVTEIKSLKEALSSLTGRVLVVLNIGLHFHARNDYHRRVREILETLSSFDRVVRVVFVETSRQNFVNKVVHIVPKYFKIDVLINNSLSIEGAKWVLCI